MTMVNKRFEKSTLENFVCHDEVEKKLVAALKSGIENGFENNIVIIGGVGTGKTHLAYAILNAMAEKTSLSSGSGAWYREDKVTYRRAKTIIDEIKSSWKSDERSPIHDLAEVPLLIIDEIGVQYGSESERIELFDLFDRRYNDVLPTIVISNNNLAALQKILGQRIYDRITGGALIFELTGISHRQTRAPAPAREGVK